MRFFGRQRQQSFDQLHPVQGAPRDQSQISGLDQQTDLTGGDLARQDDRAPRIGVTDLPAELDLLDLGPYAVGLAHFILQCPTPMTIALQGDWGAGKTSLLQMLAFELDPNQPQSYASEEGEAPCSIIRFNTWAMAQFDGGDDLIFRLLSSVLELVAPPSHDPEARAFLDRIPRGAWRAALQSGGSVLAAAAGAAVGTFGGPVGSAAVDATRQEAENYRTAAAASRRQEKIDDLRAEFARLVSKHPRRVVMLIDDLDRLQPARAIELLEAMKTIMDCDRCVFVLALDFEVVVRGASEKYGGMTERKARAYFDKFVQLPFNLPSDAYELGRLLDFCLADFRDVELNAADRERILEIVGLSVGKNPRALKRLINAFALVKQVELARDDGQEASDIQLFAALALQAGLPAVHRAMRSAQELRDFFADAAELVEKAADDREAVDQLEKWEVTDAGRFGDLIAALRGVFIPDDPDASKGAARALTVAAVAAAAPEAQTVAAARTSVLSLAERVRLQKATGGPAARVDLAAELERMMIALATEKKVDFAATLRGNGTEWGWYRTPPASEKELPRNQFAVVSFPKKGDSFNVYFAEEKWPAGVRKTFEDRAAELAQKYGWERKLGKNSVYIRLYGIDSADGFTDLASLLMSVYEYRS